MENRLRPKYAVQKALPNGALVGARMRATDPDDIDSPFVLMPRKDPAAFRALICYALYCEPDLRAEVANWLLKIAEAEPVYGTQGARNYAEMRAKEISLGL